MHALNLYCISTTQQTAVTSLNFHLYKNPQNCFLDSKHNPASPNNNTNFLIRVPIIHTHKHAPLLCCFYAHTFISEKLTGADDSVSLCPCDGSAAPSPVGGRCFNLEEGQSAEECPLSKQNKSSACLPLIWQSGASGTNHTYNENTCNGVLHA